jgi:hypothetical protein
MKKTTITIAFLATLFAARASQAGVFNIPQFVEQKSWSVGLEPEAIFTSGGSFSNTLKFTYGIGSLSNVQVGVGTGSGTRGFRTGATYTFDFIPDIDGQIGAGLAFQAYFYKVRANYGQTELTLYPYIHNEYEFSGNIAMDPYIAVPFGLALNNGAYNTITQLVVGGYFKTSKNFGFNAEIGMNMKGADSYLSGGITYRD